MFLIKKLKKNVYKFDGENNEEYSLSLKDKFLKMKRINQRFNIITSNSIPYNINPIFSSKESDFNAKELFIIQFVGYIEDEEIFSFYENYEQIFHFLMNIKAKINIPPTDIENEFIDNLETKSNFCVLFRNNIIYLIFSKKIANNLPFEINKINNDDCFYFVEINNNSDIKFFLSKKFNIPITYFDKNNKILEDKLYQLFNEKIFLRKDNIKLKIDLENNYLSNKRKIDDLLENNEQKTKQIQEIKLEIAEMQKQNSKILELEEEKGELLMRLNKERNNNKKQNKNNDLMITQSKTQQMFISSEYEYDEINNKINNSFIKENDKEIKNESMDVTEKKFICYCCLEKERNVFCKECNHIPICETCAINMAKKLNKKFKNKTLLDLKTKLKNGKLKLNCPICKKETYCFSCHFS